jgi:hypothetical protein
MKLPLMPKYFSARASTGGERGSVSYFLGKDGPLPFINQALFKGN